MSQKVFVYISMSLDGFIATKNDELDWLSVVEQEGEDYGYNAIKERTGAYIVGRKTYDTVLKLTGGSFPQAEWFDCYVITRQQIENKNGVKFYNDDIEKLVNQLKQNNTNDIYCDGGGEIVKLLLKKNLIDEFIISIIPVILGDGKRLFKGGTQFLNLKAKSCKKFESGLIQLHYEKK